MIREMPISKDNPHEPDAVFEMIDNTLSTEGFTFDEDYDIMIVPNIVNIGYGRDVGYKFTEYDLGEDIHKISATKIRNAS